MANRRDEVQYREGSRVEFGWLRIVHLDDLLSIETRIEVQDGAVVYGMRLGWKKGEPPLVGELISLHLPKSKTLVRVSRVARTCVCCAHGITYLYVEQTSGVLPDPSICACARRRELLACRQWRDYTVETTCPRKSRAVLSEVSATLKSRKEIK